MPIKRIDHTSIIVDNLPEAINFFTALGMELEGETFVQGSWVDDLSGLKNMQVDIAMMQTPDKQGRVELTKFRNPALVGDSSKNLPPNTLGLKQIMFEVDDLDDTLAQLKTLGAPLIGKVVQYEDNYRLCYVRGPAGIIVALSEDIS